MTIPFFIPGFELRDQDGAKRVIGRIKSDHGETESGEVCVWHGCEYRPAGYKPISLCCGDEVSILSICEFASAMGTRRASNRCVIGKRQCADIRFGDKCSSTSRIFTQELSMNFVFH